MTIDQKLKLLQITSQYILPRLKSVYTEKVKDEDHLKELMNKEPLWELLETKDFCDLVFHVSGHHTLIKKLKPKNKEQLAAVLAIIRPAKRHLQDSSWEDIFKEVWVKPKEGYYFKKAHAVAYAHAIVVHMNLICEELNGLGSTRLQKETT